MNLSAEILGVLERALQERYEAGVEVGRLEANIAADEAHDEGYTQAMHEVASWARAKIGALKPSSAPRPRFVEPEEADRIIEQLFDEPAQKPHLSPAKAKIVDFVGGNPGVTAAEVQRACGGSNSTVYNLTKLGLLTKKGQQFYPNPFAGS